MTLPVPRFLAEQADRDRAVVFFREDVQFLAGENGLTETEFLQQLNAGKIYVIEEDGLGYAPDGTAAFVAGADVELMEGPASDDAFVPLNGIVQTTLPQLLIENKHRSDMHAPAGFDAEVYEGETLRGVYLFRGYRNRVDGDDPSSVADLLYLAATDRGLRALIVRPFGDRETAEVCTNVAMYRECLADVRQRLEERGLTLGEDLSTMTAQPRQPILLALAGLASVLAVVWLFCRIPVFKRWKNHLLILGLLADAALCLLMPAFAQKGFMLATALFLPAVALVMLILEGGKPGAFPAHGPFPVRALGLTVAVVLSGIVSGLVVAALMSSRAYLLSTDIFSGVKLSLLMPVVLAGILLLVMLRKQLRPKSGSDVIILLIFLALLAVIALGLLLRSGDTQHISTLENSIRVWLERTLYARPRTKELLLAAPCVPIYLWAREKNFAPLQLLTGLGVALEIASVFNTFCHAVTPLRVSVIRSLLGAGLGFVIGLIACGVLQGLFLLIRKQPRQ